MEEYEVGVALSAEEFTRRMHQLVPISGQLGIVATSLGESGEAVVRLPYLADLVRPGGSISGPAVMALIDVAMFAGINGHFGWTPMAMTANLNTTFLKPPKLEDLIGCAKPLRLGRRLAFFEVHVYSSSDQGSVVAHGTGSYALPQ
jgi:uncharacterized protein (TIGR00369 family)